MESGDCIQFMKLLQIRLGTTFAFWFWVLSVEVLTFGMVWLSFFADLRTWKEQEPNIYKLFKTNGATYIRKSEAHTVCQCSSHDRSQWDRKQCLGMHSAKHSRYTWYTGTLHKCGIPYHLRNATHMCGIYLRLVFAPYITTKRAWTKHESCVPFILYVDIYAGAHVS